MLAQSPVPGQETVECSTFALMWMEEAQIDAVERADDPLEAGWILFATCDPASGGERRGKHEVTPDLTKFVRADQSGERRERERGGRPGWRRSSSTPGNDRPFARRVDPDPAVPLAQGIAVAPGDDALRRILRGVPGS